MLPALKRNDTWWIFAVQCLHFQGLLEGTIFSAAVHIAGIFAGCEPQCYQICLMQPVTFKNLMNPRPDSARCLHEIISKSTDIK